MSITREVRFVDYEAHEDLDVRIAPRSDGTLVLLLPQQGLPDELTLESAKSLHELLGEAIEELATMEVQEVSDET